MAIVDITGQRFGRWTVTGLDPNSGRVKYWLCRCDCGSEKSVFGGDLKRGGSTSCGCLKIEAQRERLTTHGLSRHPAYRSWIYMHQRCEDQENESYALYGGRGITVCEAWATFKGFWADMAASWLKGGSIERLDVDGHYEPGNCTWATAKEQANNRRDNHIIPTPWGPMNVSEAAERAGIKREAVFARIRYGWPESRLLEPIKGSKAP